MGIIANLVGADRVWAVVVLAAGIAGMVATLTIGGTLWLCWRALTRQIDNIVASKVSGYMDNIRATQRAAVEPSPAQQKDIAEVTLFQFDRLRSEFERLSDLLVHVAAGGHPDAPQREWIKPDAKRKTTK